MQSQTLPQLPPQKTGTELAGSFQPDPIYDDSRHLRIIVCYLDMRGKQFQLLGFALLVKDFDAFQPPRLRRSVQLTQVAQRPLARTVPGSHRLHQRPVDMLLTLFRPVVRSQEHLAPIMSSHPSLFKMVGLHYTPFFACHIAKTTLLVRLSSNHAGFNSPPTNFG